MMVAITNFKAKIADFAPRYYTGGNSQKYKPSIEPLKALRTSFLYKHPLYSPLGVVLGEGLFLIATTPQNLNPTTVSIEVK